MFIKLWSVCTVWGERVGRWARERGDRDFAINYYDCRSDSILLQYYSALFCDPPRHARHFGLCIIYLPNQPLSACISRYSFSLVMAGHGRGPSPSNTNDRPDAFGCLTCFGCTPATHHPSGLHRIFLEKKFQVARRTPSQEPSPLSLPLTQSFQSHLSTACRSGCATIFCG